MTSQNLKGQGSSRRVAIILAVAAVLAAARGADPAHAGSGVQYSRDRSSTLISKDVGAERWAITYRVDDGAAFGNVFYPDGRDPSFISCDRIGVNGSDSSYRCYGANRCPGEPCGEEQYSFIAEVSLPTSFFFPPSGPTPTPSPTPGPGGDTVTCGATATLVAAIAYDEASVPDLSGVTLEIAYPASVSIPGVGSDPSVADRVVNLSNVSGGLFQVGDDDSRISVGLVSLGTPIPPGGFASIRFDCAPGTTVSTSQFPCTPVGSSSLGLEVNVACGLSLTAP